MTDDKWTVVDLFSGGGGMSYGFHSHPQFKIIGAVDAQKGKPSSKHGSLQCNLTYEMNIGIQPLNVDLGNVDPTQLRESMGLEVGELDVLISCAPCTGFSRTMSKNHIVDDPRNTLVQRTVLFVNEFQPSILLMENARELIAGNFRHHYEKLRNSLRDLGYVVHGQTHFLSKYGLPQKRERALIIATKSEYPLRTLDDLWEGCMVRTEAVTVRRAIGSMPAIEAGEKNKDDPIHTSPSFSDPTCLRRIHLIPHNGGSWSDLVKHREAVRVLTPAMKRYAAKGIFGSHPDVYGRLWWDRPAVTIKRECAHIGNGRYAHPEQDRLCSVREMAILQGFPKDYKFIASGLANMYRHIGDAVPPLISFQLSKVCEWILSGEKPEIETIVLPNTHLKASDIVSAEYQLKIDNSFIQEERTAPSKIHERDTMKQAAQR
ncbi:MAG: DNA cytosine methyltransferase [Thermoleophilia bacterium]